MRYYFLTVPDKPASLSLTPKTYNISAVWEEPDMSNGIIVMYNLTLYKVDKDNNTVGVAETTEVSPCYILDSIGRNTSSSASYCFDKIRFIGYTTSMMR